jgi:hypothetical protein
MNARVLLVGSDYVQESPAVFAFGYADTGNGHVRCGDFQNGALN